MNLRPRAAAAGVAALASLLSACPIAVAPRDTAEVRVGVDSALVDLGLAAFVRAAYEAERPERLVLRGGDLASLRAKVETGEVDVIIGSGHELAEELERRGLLVERADFAHEEMVFIGPAEDKFRAHGSTDPVELLKNIVRSTHLFLEPRAHSVERAVYARLQQKSGDRPGVGALVESDRDGPALVEEVVERRAFGLVRRSALVRAAADGHAPHRVYMDGHPALVLPLFAARVPESKTRRPPRPGLVAYLAGEAGRRLVERFGAERYGLPLFARGLPPAGQGAKVSNPDEQ